MEYNTSREKLIIPEYGRNVQKMIQQCAAMKDREERNRFARQIIMVMGQLNPQMKEFNDFKHKLWDHLFIIADFNLDVDSPYDKPEKGEFTMKPHRVQYPDNKIKYRHFGKNVENLIDEIAKMDSGKAKDQAIINIANFMKLSYMTWNKDSVTDEIILSNLRELSGGKIEIPADARLSQTIEIPKQQSHQKKNKRKRGGGNFKRKRNR